MAVVGCGKLSLSFFFFGGLFLFAEVSHDFSETLFDVVDAFACMPDEVPIQSTRQMMLELMSSNLSCICLSMVCTNWFNSLVLGSSLSFFPSISQPLTIILQTPQPCHINLVHDSHTQSIPTMTASHTSSINPWTACARVVNCSVSSVSQHGDSALSFHHGSHPLLNTHQKSSRERSVYGLKARTLQVLLVLLPVLVVQSRQQVDLGTALPVDRGRSHQDAEGSVEGHLLVGWTRQTRQVVHLAEAHCRKQFPGHLLLSSHRDLLVAFGVSGQCEFAFVEVQEGTAHSCCLLLYLIEATVHLGGGSAQGLLSPHPAALHPKRIGTRIWVDQAPNSYKNMMSQPRSLTVFEKVVNTGFNIRFQLLGLLDAFSSTAIGKPGQEVYLLGQCVKVQHHNQQEQNQLLLDIFRDTPWLTYRAGFPELYHDLKGTYVSDTGWGCMVRVGQMAFAQVIRRHRHITRPEDMLALIRLFSDFEKEEPFSIHSISRLARREYGVLPGDWYNPSQISHLLSQLHSQHLQQTDKLAFLVFNSGNLFLDQAAEVMMGKSPACHCKQSRAEDLGRRQGEEKCKEQPEGNGNEKEKEPVCSRCNKAEYGLGLVLLARIGLQSPEEKYLGVLSEMMKLRSFAGIIGGRPGKALYLLGLHADGSYIYLDPHYVQQAQPDLSQIKETYSCLSFRACRPSSIDPSFGLVYYLRDVGELNQFWSQLSLLRKSKEGEFFLWMSEETPQYLAKSIRSRAVQLEEDDYHTL